MPLLLTTALIFIFLLVLLITPSPIIITWQNNRLSIYETTFAPPPNLKIPLNNLIILEAWSPLVNYVSQSVGLELTITMLILVLFELCFERDNPLFMLQAARVFTSLIIFSRAKLTFPWV